MVDPIVQKADFTRSATKDRVSNTVSFGGWEPPSVTLPAVTPESLPKIEGYNLDPSFKGLPAKTVTAESQNESVTIMYQKQRVINESSSPDYWYDYNNVKKPIIKTYELGLNEGDSAKTTNDYIIAHSTATPNATAKQEAQYFKNNWSSSETYTQLVVDDKDCYLIGDLGYVAWGAGYTGNHKAPVQIELCEFPNDRIRALEAYTNFVHLLRQFANIYGIPKLLDRNGRGIKTHNYLARTNHETSHTDPQTYLSSIGISFEQFRSDVEGTNSTSSTGQDTGTTTTDPAKDVKGEVWWSIDPNTKLPVGFTEEHGTFQSWYEIKNRRSAPVLTNKSTGSLYANQRQKYDSVAKIGDYTWIHYRVGTPPNGKYEKPETFHGIKYREFYLPVRKWNDDGTSEAWGAFY